MKAHIVVTFDKDRGKPRIAYCGQDAQAAVDLYNDIRDNAKAPNVAMARNVRFDKEAKDLRPKPKTEPKKTEPENTEPDKAEG